MVWYPFWAILATLAFSQLVGIGVSLLCRKRSPLLAAMLGFWFSALAFPAIRLIIMYFSGYQGFPFGANVGGISNVFEATTLYQSTITNAVLSIIVFSLLFWVLRKFRATDGEKVPEAPANSWLGSLYIPAAIAICGLAIYLSNDIFFLRAERQVKLDRKAHFQVARCVGCYFAANGTVPKDLETLAKFAKTRNIFLNGVEDTMYKQAYAFIAPEASYFVTCRSHNSGVFTVITIDKGQSLWAQTYYYDGFGSFLQEESMSMSISQACP